MTNLKDLPRRGTIWGVSVDATLDEKARAEAARRGMNFSEFIRYCVRLAFDLGLDHSPENRDGEVTL